MNDFYNTLFNIPTDVAVIATSNEEARHYVNNAMNDGMTVHETTVWTGPVPPDSLVWIAPGISMATPEYMMLRKTNQLPHDEAVMVCCALLSHYDTHYTSRSVKAGEAFYHGEPHTTPMNIMEYLMPIMATPEAQKCFEILQESLTYLPAFESWCATVCR